MTSTTTATTNPFIKAGLDEELSEAVLKAFPLIEELTSIQEEAISKIIPNLTDRSLAKDRSQIKDSSDFILKSKTGTGKTLAFLLPIIHSMLREERANLSSNLSNPSSKTSIDRRSQIGTQVILIMPTRELAVQTQEMCEKIISKLRGTSHWITSGTLSGGDRRKNEKERLRRGLHIVVGTPGRILDHLEHTQKWTSRLPQSLKFLVLDEADRLLDMGFSASLKSILELTGVMQTVGRASTRIILSSATVDCNLKEICGRELKNPLIIQEVKRTFNDIVPLQNQLNVEHRYIVVPTKIRLVMLISLLRDIGASKKVVVFSICCETVNFLHEFIEKISKILFSAEGRTGIKIPKVMKLHGSIEHLKRIETYKAFMKEDCGSILIATDVAARGLNLCDVNNIIQYDLPCDPSDYIHRAGRTGRIDNRESGQNYLFLMPNERKILPILQEKGLTLLEDSGWENKLLSLIDSKIIPFSLKGSSGRAGGEDDEQEEDINVTSNLILKRHKVKLTAFLESFIKKYEFERMEQAKLAYLSFLRAYATHPSSLKSFMHIKNLHLGHLAQTFILKEAPTKVLTSFKGDKKKIERLEEKKRIKMDKKDRNEGGDGIKKGGNDGSGRNTSSSFKKEWWKDEDPKDDIARKMKKQRHNPSNEFSAGSF